MEIQEVTYDDIVNWLRENAERDFARRLQALQAEWYNGPKAFDQAPAYCAECIMGVYLQERLGRKDVSVNSYSARVGAEREKRSYIDWPARLGNLIRAFDEAMDQGSTFTGLDALQILGEDME